MITGDVNYLYVKKIINDYFGDWKSLTAFPEKPEYKTNINDASGNKIRFVKLEPNGSIGPHNDNINPNKEELLDDQKSIWPITVSLKEPGKKCHTVVEGFGIVPIKEGRTYLLNPYRKHVVVNTSDTEECVRLRTQAIPGKRFGEFVNCITRTYFELEGRLGQDYLRQLPIKPKKGPKQTVMDY